MTTELDSRSEMSVEFSAYLVEMRRQHELWLAEERRLVAEIIAQLDLLDEHWNGRPRRKRQ